jgi:DNA-binding NtrC family response regulator
VSGSKTPPGRLLIVDDDRQLVEQMTWTLKGMFEIQTAGDARTGRALLESGPELCLFDLRLPPSNKVEEGLALLEEARRLDPDVTVIMMSGEGERRDVLRAIALGAFDFFEKPVEPSELLVILKRALERRRLVAENRALRQQVDEARPFGRLLGNSAPMRRLFRQIEKVAPSDAAVLLIGESGTGKELVAHSIHERSERGGRAFVAVNAAALPESLAEVELFGHERGAFTGAVGARPGRFEVADGGTLFLDEIGTLSPAVQAKLLRVLESHEVERVGGHRRVRTDFRLICATNEDLEARVASGTFREDLFYRINAVALRIPPLRERGEDIVLLAEHFLALSSARHGGGARRLSPAVVDRLQQHLWKGNVRELEHVIETLVLFSEGEEIGQDDLPRILRPETSSAIEPASFQDAVAGFEKKLLEDAIAKAGGVKAVAARRLGLDANQIKYLCRKYRV